MAVAVMVVVVLAVPPASNRNRNRNVRTSTPFSTSASKQVTINTIVRGENVSVQPMQTDDLPASGDQRL
jgi:hypothetical protein